MTIHCGCKLSQRDSFQVLSTLEILYLVQIVPFLLNGDVHSPSNEMLSEMPSVHSDERSIW